MRGTVVQLIILFLMTSCMGSKNVNFTSGFEVVGHRGNVSRFPENSIPGFLSAVELGVDALELDLVISADKMVVVSHEPYMAAAQVLTPEGDRIKRSREKNHNMYEMSYDRIRQYQTGQIRQEKYPRQLKFKAYKPLLTEVFREVENHLNQANLIPITYYLEVKSRPRDYEIFQPSPEEFVDLIMEVVKQNDMQNRIVIKSFDAQFLNELKRKYPTVKTSYLIYRTKWREGLLKLDFKPDVLSPYYKQVKSKAEVQEMKQTGLKLIPWTVNKSAIMKKLINYGVDGIITDYPERLIKLR